MLIPFTQVSSMTRTPRIIMSLTAFLLTGSMCGQGAATAQEDHFRAPTTISPEARQAVGAFSRKSRDNPLPKPGDIEGWKKAQAGIEPAFAPASAEVVKQYRPTIESRMLGGVPVLDIKPKNWKENTRVLVYTHGGAYTLCSAKSTLNSAVPVANDTRLRVISVDYTVAPHAKWNQIIDQVVAVITALVKEGHELDSIAIYGESAGGGLAAGTVLKMRDAGLGMPVAVVLWSPWSDITETGDSYDTLKDADPVLRYADNLKNCADAYADPSEQKNPYVSPIYADYTKGFPPTLIQCGTKEIFLSNCVRHYQRLDRAGISVKFDPYEGMYHVFQAFNWNLPESNLARTKMKTFLAEHLRE